MNARRSAGGFTLIEILVVTAMLMFILGAVYAAFYGALRLMEVNEEKKTLDQKARVILDRMGSDLESVVFVDNDKAYTFEGVKDEDDEMRRDRLNFVTASHPVDPTVPRESDLMEVGYYLDPELRTVLVRREDVTLDKEPTKGGRLDVLAEGVAGLAFSYYFEENLGLTRDKWAPDQTLRDEDWLDEWDPQKRRVLPWAVRIEITLLSEEDEPVTFSTTVRLEPGSRGEAQ